MIDRRTRSSIFAALLLVAGLLVALSVQALGLGEMSASSYLGQPLQASIAVNQGQKIYTADEVRVRQLTGREAAELGIDLAGYQQRFVLETVDVDNAIVITLRSRKPINEPFLNVLVELSWPTGTIYREYTVLLDPIGFAVAAPVQSASQPASQPSSSTSSSSSVQPSTLQSRPTQASPQRPSRRAESEAAAKLAMGDETYRVQVGDSLSKIAQRLVAGASLQRSEMMSWLLANNPRAFINGDQNRILAGVRLALPADSNTVRLSRQAAASAAAKKPPTAVKTPATQTNNPAEPLNDAERLTIVTPGVSEDSFLKGDIPAADSIDALSTQIAVTNEVVDRLSRENQAMRKRLQAMEQSDYIASLERLMELKDREIDALKNPVTQPSVASASTVDNEGSAEQSLDPSAEPTLAGQPSNVIGDANERQLWLLVLLVLAVAGALFFFYRWRSKEDAGESLPSTADDDDDVLEFDFDELVLADESIVAAEVPSTAKPSVTVSEQQLLSQIEELATANHQQPIAQAPNPAMDAIKKGFHAASGRRAEGVVRDSIREKTHGYVPVTRPMEPSSMSQHDDLDDLISEAISAANRGDYAGAKSMLNGEKFAQSGHSEAKRQERTSRLDLALEFIDHLRGSAQK